MIVNIWLDDGAFPIEKAYPDDAGFDIRSPKDVFVRGGCSAVIDTGVHVEIPQGHVGMLKSKSGLNVKRNIVSEGVIDSGYTGSIVVKLYNLGIRDYSICKGDKISQLVIMPISQVEGVKIIKEPDVVCEGRGNNGFGSTGK